ncbi:superoxide dismutase copper/zinc binding protein [Paenibacillus vortex V453]|uniref:Superoxide dismutase copper/zinc binding protein n=1 Tax=Paenibacillus vortex V453 TaxID=715225 RepID=A0A2R9SZB1_9BACL|nr:MULTISPECIES: superoxide dismutase family protein [Paenibacillus]AWP29449.1 superoxide dismutase [Paenibacillus sp. Cedars]EFU42704.1 superoxide dismutase copper/zinc binding protein [Paenibacillus vortex V453]
MKKKTNKLKYMAGAFVAGALLFTGILFAAANPEGTLDAKKHSMSKISHYVNGKDNFTADGPFAKQGTAASDSKFPTGSSDVPARMVSDPVNQPVFWDQAFREETLGHLVVKLYNAAGESVGSATLEQINDGVKVKITASGLTPGKHGFHVHENTIKDRDFKSAGGHFNPTDKHHGLKHPQGSHVGDMPNLVVGADGTVEAEMIIQHGTLGKNQPNSVLGRSLIIHAGEDDEVTDPSGNSGDRVAGGNIPE